MEAIASQSSYEHLPDEQLMQAYEIASTQYWNALEIAHAAEVTKSAIANVIQQRRRQPQA